MGEGQVWKSLKRFLFQETSSFSCKFLVRRVLTKPWTEYGFPKFPMRRNFLASPHLVLPRKSIEDLNNFLNWQRDGAYEDSEGPQFSWENTTCLEFGEDVMNTVFSSGVWLTLLWSLSNSCWMERSFLPMAGSFAIKFWVSGQILQSHIPLGFMPGVWEKIPQIKHMAEL